MAFVSGRVKVLVQIRGQRCPRICTRTFTRPEINVNVDDQPQVNSNNRANHVNTDKAAIYELPHLDLRCLQIHLFPFLALQGLIP